MAHVADIARFDQHAAADFMLHIQVVLIRNRRHLIWIEIRNGGIRRLAKRYGAERRSEWGTNVGWKPAREREHNLGGSLRDRIGCCSREAERGDITDGIADCRSVEDAGAATNDGAALTGNPIGEAEAWTKVVEVSRKRAGRNPIHPGEGDDTGSAGHRVDRKRVE